MTDAPQGTGTTTVLPPAGPGGPAMTGTPASPPPSPRRGVPMWLVVALLIAVAAIVGGAMWFMGSGNPPAPVATTTTTTTTTTVTSTTTVPAVTTSEAVETSAPVPSTETTEPPVAPPAKKTTLPYTPGPNETGTNYAYLRTMKLKSGYVYITVDYILVGEGADGWFITNNNKKLRTFPLAKSCPCRYLIEGTASLSGALSPTAFRTKWNAASSSKMIKRNPYIVTVKKGVVTKLSNLWLP